MTIPVSHIRRSCLVAAALAATLAGGCALPAASLQPEPARPSGSPPTAAAETTPAQTQTPAEPTRSTAVSELAMLLETREQHRRLLHDATQLGIAACMADRGLRYTPVAYPGALGQNADLEGLSPAEAEEWTRALLGAPIPPEMVVGSDPITDPTILVAEGPESAAYFRSDACTTVGRAAVYGDLVEWFTVEQTVDHLTEQAFDDAGGDRQRRTEIESRLAVANRAAVDEFARLQDSAIDRARVLLAGDR
ncbi:MAG: hypothetical protein LCH76_16205 [Actinobacteria bacterium]|nr:hypothetical protein [Actinomycetota bacterium]